MARDDIKLSFLTYCYYYVLFVFFDLSSWAIILFLNSLFKDSYLSESDRKSVAEQYMMVIFFGPIILAEIHRDRQWSRYKMMKKLNQNATIPQEPRIVMCSREVFIPAMSTAVLKLLYLQTDVEEIMASLVIILCYDGQWTRPMWQLLVYGSGVVLHVTPLIFLLFLGEENFKMIVTLPFMPFLLVWKVVKWFNREVTQLITGPTLWPKKHSPPTDHIYDSGKRTRILRL